MPAGLAPVPAHVGRAIFELDVDGAPATCSWWFLRQSGTPEDWSTAEAIADDVFLRCGGDFAALVAASCRIVACHVELGGPGFASARVQVDPVPGVWSGSQALNVAAGLHWIGSVRGRGTQSVTRLPSVPDSFVDSTWRLSSVGYANLRDHGASFLNNFNLATDGGGSTILHGTLHRWRSGVPLLSPVFDATLAVVPAPELLTIRRRLPRGPRVSPT